MSTSFVDIESPYGSLDEKIVKRNILYARACVRDALGRGEIPYASHIFFTQPGILDDNNPKERKNGIEAGKEITRKLRARTVAYTDLGISDGMREGIERAEKEGREVEYRTLGDGWEKIFNGHATRHSQSGIW